MEPKIFSASSIDRRDFLRLAALGVGASAVATLTGCGLGQSRNPINTVGQVNFRNPLNIPPLAEPTQHAGRRVFNLTIQAGRSAIIPGGEADTWGINGPLLGPTLRARRGDNIVINVQNDLHEATTLHWHGMHLPAVADGGPHQMIDPGTVWTPSWTINQPAATLWYHPHPHGQTERHVYQGLAGLFIIDDDEEARLKLPRKYGIDDIPVIVQDKTFDRSGQLIETSRRDNGMLGDTILVNGTVEPILDISTQLTRLRLLNASTARNYAFGFADNRQFAMIASDGGLLSSPLPLSRIQLSPGERAEIVVEMAPDESVTLRSYPQDLGVSRSRARSTGAEDELDILLLRAQTTLRPSALLPPVLTWIEPLRAATVATNRDFELRSRRINGNSMDMNRIDSVVNVDTTEIWDVVNGHRQPHNFHVHDVQFQVISIDGQIPTPELAGWKDTIYLPPGVPITLIMRFADYVDPSMPYMYHCHLLWHEDEGMMGQFVVVEPGQNPESIGIGHEHSTS